MNIYSTGCNYTVRPINEQTTVLLYLQAALGLLRGLFPPPLSCLSPCLPAHIVLLCTFVVCDAAQYSTVPQAGTSPVEITHTPTETQKHTGEKGRHASLHTCNKHTRGHNFTLQTLCSCPFVKAYSISPLSAVILPLQPPPPSHTASLPSPAPS